MTILHAAHQYELPVPSSPSLAFDSITSVSLCEPAGLIALGYESGTVALIRKSTGSLYCLPAKTAEKTPVTAAALSPDGKQLALSSSHHMVEHWFLPSCTLTGCYYGHRAGVEDRSGSITALCWTPDNCRIASGSSDGSLHIWHASSLHHLGTFVERTMNKALASPISALAWSPDGSLLADITGSTLRIWDTAGHLQRALHIPPGEKAITALAWVWNETLEDTAILVGRDDGTLQQCFLKDGTWSAMQRDHSCSGPIKALAWFPKYRLGELAYVDNSANDTRPLLHLHQFSLPTHL